jgi:hypothetical protein
MPDTSEIAMLPSKRTNDQNESYVCAMLDSGLRGILIGEHSWRCNASSCLA